MKSADTLFALTRLPTGPGQRRMCVQPLVLCRAPDQLSVPSLPPLRASAGKLASSIRSVSDLPRSLWTRACVFYSVSYNPVQPLFILVIKL